MEITGYKCPNCGGQVKFDSSVQKMKCPYCGTEFEIGALDGYRQDTEGGQGAQGGDGFGWDAALTGTAAGGASPREVLDGLGSGSCPSCGAELVFGENTTASVCPCCGNAQIALKRLEGILKPGTVIPFQLEKKDAVEALKGFYKGKRLLPDFFKEENRVNSIQGMYVPFWLFDAEARGRIVYKASRVRAWSDAEYNYVKTDYYSAVRDGGLRFEKIPVDGSDKMDDSYMDAIEPFDYSGLKDFESAYLAGYSAEKYDMDADACKDRAGRRIKATLEAQFAASVTGYSSVVQQRSSISVENSKADYALFPVWILNTKYKKENYLFIMNGQSGRLAGRLPADTGKSWKYRFLIAGVSGAVLTAFIQLLKVFM